MGETELSLAETIAQHRLKALFPLCELDETQQRALSSQAQLTELSAGDRLEAEARRNRFSYLLRGRLDLVTDGGQQSIEHTSAASILPLFGPELGGTAVTATEASVLLEFPAEALTSPLEQADEFFQHRQLLMATYHTYIDEQGSLPSLPDVAMRINRAIDNSNIELRDIARVVVADPILSAKLLQVANSPIYRGDRPFDTVQDALLRLGLTTAQNLALTLSIERLFNTRSAEAKALVRRLYDESLQIGCIGYVIARENGQFNPEKALLAGLIHNLGAIALIVTNSHRDSPLPMEQLEVAVRRLRGPAGHIILTAMEFTPEMVAVATEAEAWWRAGNDRADYTDIVMIAKLHSQIGREPLPDLPRLDQLPAYRRLGLGEFDPQQGLLYIKKAQNLIEALLQLLR